MTFDLNELCRRIVPNQPTSPPQISAISHLPPEILAQIFFHSVPSEQFPIPCHNEAPLLLTRISSYWRTLAINTPDLWSAFHINYKDPEEDTPATNLWLARSTNRPLSLSLAIDFGEQSQQGILDALCRHSNRWKHVRFDFRHLYCPPMYSLDIAEDSIPELTAFEFHARDISSTNLSQITRLLKTAPKLRDVTWVDDLADTNMLLELPLNQLTRLSLAMDHGTLDYFQILNRCSNLEQIRITRPLPSSSQTKPSLLFLHKLTSLNISYDLTAVLDHLVLPALKHVRIFTANDGTDKHGQQSYPTQPYSYESLVHRPRLRPRVPQTSSRSEFWDPLPLISLIDRSACEIATLSLGAPMKETALLFCLSMTSASLTSLEVEGAQVGDMVLSHLTRRWDEGRRSEDEEDQNEDFLCPKLEDLILHTQIISSQGILADMIASRLSPSSNSEDCMTGNLKQTTLRKLVIVDGHWDLSRLSSLSQSTSLSRGSEFKVYIIPRKSTSKSRTRNFVFRRKLCASR